MIYPLAELLPFIITIFVSFERMIAKINNPAIIISHF